MPKRIILAIITILISVSGLSAQIESPKLTPVPSNETQQRLIKEGIVLHDNNDYDGALHKYEEVLKENPDNIEAIYEETVTYSAKGDYKKSLEAGYRGAGYKSQLLAAFYMSVGNNLDDLGDSKKAIEVYKAGLKIAPSARLLNYNLAVTYKKTGEPEVARKYVKRSVSVDPNHASSHRLLGELFNAAGYKTPALLAMTRFLVLEPYSSRSASAYNVVREVLQGGVSAGDKPGDINIMVDMSSKKDEGDFDTVNMMLGLSKAADSLEENKGKTKAQLAVVQLNTFFSILSELDEKANKSKFVFKYYVPYFIELKKRNYVEPFYYYISRSTNDPEVVKWLDGNVSRVNEFLNWSVQFKWPKIDD